MSIKKRHWVLIAGLAIIVAIYGLLVERKCRAGLDILTSPVDVTEIAALPDGGSLTITLRSADGRNLALERVGSLAIASGLQELRSVSWFWVIPVSCNAPKGSPLEREGRQLLKTWLSDKLTAQQETALAQNDLQAVNKIPPTILGVHDLITWIDKRK